MLLLIDTAKLASGIVLIIMCLVGAFVSFKLIKGILKFIIEIVCLAVFIVAICMVLGVI